MKVKQENLPTYEGTFNKIIYQPTKEHFNCKISYQGTIRKRACKDHRKPKTKKTDSLSTLILFQKKKIS